MPKNTAQRIIDARTGSSGALFLSGGAGGSSGGVTDHGLLTGLADDDHSQYHTDARGDARYVPLARTVTAGAGLTGGGALDVDRTLALASSVAGAGLAFAAGVLNMGVANTGAAGLTVETDQVRLTSSSGPGASASVLATDASGYLSIVRLILADRLRSPLIDTVSGNLSIQPAGDLYINTGTGIVRLASGDLLQSNSFASGWTGSGWRIDDGVTEAGKMSAEFDNITVRGRMRIYEALIQQLRASNGSVFVTSASKVVSVTTATNPNWTVNGSQLTFNGSAATLTTVLYTISTAAAGDTSRELYHGFLVGDVIRAQQTQWNGSQFAGVMLSNLEVTAVTNLYTYQAALVSGDAPAAGYDYVRLGSTSDSTRRGGVYMTSDDSNAPFIDIVDGIQYHSDWGSAGVKRVRLGKLSGISDAAFGGTLPGYGLYGNNVYIKGQIVVTGGSLGGLAASDINSNTTTIDGGKITANSVTADRISATTLSAITADLGTVTAGSIVVGSTNKLWLNDSADGKLAIGGSVKASAPFQVAADGSMSALNATLGTYVYTDSTGMYISAPSSWSYNYGYRFKWGTTNAAGLTSIYGGGVGKTDLYNNASSGSAAAAVANIDATTLVRNVADGTGYASSIELQATHVTRATTAKFVLANTTGGRTATIEADNIYLKPASTNLKIWHEGNDGSGSGLDADTLDTYTANDFALRSGTTFTGTVQCNSTIVLAPQSTHPAYISGYIVLYCYSADSNSISFRARMKTSNNAKEVETTVAFA